MFEGMSPFFDNEITKTINKNKNKTFQDFIDGDDLPFKEALT